MAIKNKFELAMVNAPSVLELLRFDCIAKNLPVCLQIFNMLNCQNKVFNSRIILRRIQSVFVLNNQRKLKKKKKKVYNRNL